MDDFLRFLKANANFGTAFFLVMTALALAGALVTVSARNPIRSAVGLLVTIVGIAGLFVRLNAEFMAAIQLIVYAGAVVVLFVFVIMLLGPDAATPAGVAKSRASRVFAGVFMVLVCGAGAGLFLAIRPVPTRLQPVAPEYGTVEVVGRELFTKAVVPFELATALLIVAVVGAIAVARSRHRPKPRPAVENPTRMFVGPLMPRDAQHPLGKERA